MQRLTVVAGLVLGLVGVLTGATRTLGTITAEGDFKLNDAAVRGNATLTSGATVESLDYASTLRLAEGGSLKLDPRSRVRVFEGRLVLEQGSGEWRSQGGYTLEAATLRIAPAGDRGTARLVLAGGKVLQAAALSGRFRIRNASGVLVSHLDPGAALSLEPQVGGPAAPTSVIGCLLKKDSKYIVYDQTTRVEYELRGGSNGYEKEVNNRVQANGTSRAAAGSAPQQILDVTTVTRIESGGCQDIAGLIGADQAKPVSLPTRAPVAVEAGKKGGMSAGVAVAIVGAIGGGAAGAVLATQGKNRSN